MGTCLHLPNLVKASLAVRGLRDLSEVTEATQKWRAGMEGGEGVCVDRSGMDSLPHKVYFKMRDINCELRF